MDKKTEEMISQLAFGELSESEAAKVRELAARQPDGAAALDAYQSMREDLRRLKDVPPDQLSKERLQNAILARGLKPKPVRNGISWLWVPSTALAIFFGMFILSRVPSGTSGPLEVQDHESLSAMILNEDDMSMADQLRKATFNGAVSVGQDESGLTKPMAANAVAPEPEAASVREAPPVPVVSRARSFRATKSAPAKEVAAASLQVQPSPSHGPLVIIQSGKDMSTGAQSAVEVSQTEDVIVSS